MEAQSSVLQDIPLGEEMGGGLCDKEAWKRLVYRDAWRAREMCMCPVTQTAHSRETWDSFSYISGEPQMDSLIAKFKCISFILSIKTLHLPNINKLLPGRWVSKTHSKVLSPHHHKENAQLSWNFHRRQQKCKSKCVNRRKPICIFF